MTVGAMCTLGHISTIIDNFSSGSFQTF